MPTLEQLQIKVSETKNKIEVSKNLSSEEKLTKATELEMEVFEIKKNLDLLKKDATTEELQKIEELMLEYEVLKNQLGMFKKELEDFQKNILNNVGNESESTEQKSEEEIAEKDESWWDKNKKTVLIGASTLGIGLLLRRWWKKRKEKKSNSNSTEKKPWYKKRRTRVGVGVAGFLGRRYWGDIKNLWDRLWGKEKDKKDEFGKEIAQHLGSDWRYDEAGNYFEYKSKKYKRDDFYKKDLIHTNMDKNGKLVLDVEKTVEAIKNFVKEDIKTLPDKHKLADLEKYRLDRDNLDNIEKEKYFKLDGQIGDFYNRLYDKKLLEFSSDKHGIDRGYLLYHIDQSFNNIGSLLDENTFHLFVDSTTKTMVESIFNYFPGFIVNSFLGAAKGMNIIGLDKFAEDTSNLGEYLKNLKPTEITKIEELCRFFYEHSTAVAYYAYTVRETYKTKVKDNPDKIKEFNEKQLKDLDLSGEISVELKDSIVDPKIDKKLDNRVEGFTKREKKLLNMLDSAKTTEEQKKVIEKLINELDDIGYNTWNGVFSLARGFMWETNKYVDYDIISSVYEESFSGLRGSLKDLLKKQPLTDSDKEEIKRSIQDFYGTMMLVQNQTKLRQGTDEDGKLFTIMEFPVMRGGKVVYRTMATYMEDGKYGMVALTLTTSLLALDAATWAPRKVLSLFRGKSKLFLSPTDFVMRKLGKGVIPLFGGSLEYAFRTPTRLMNQAMNKNRLHRFINFRTPESLLKAVNKGHIRLKDAATLAAKKASGKSMSGVSIERWFGKERRTLGFSENSIEKNMIRLLEENQWVRKNIGIYNDLSKKNYELLIKHWDTKKLTRARLRGYNGNKLEKLLIELSNGTTSKAASKLNRLSKGSLLSKETNLIIKKRQNVEKISKEIFANFENELAEEATKKGVAKETLSKKIWESEQYGPKLEKLLAENNNLIAKSEESIMKKFNKASWANKQLLYENDKVIKRIVDANGGIQKWRLPAVGRYGRLVSVGIHAIMIGWTGSSKDESGNKKDRGTIGGEAADFGLGMIPVAGGAYDIGMAFRGKDLNGRKMGTGERRIRGSVGLVTGVIDVFSLGVGGTAIRAAVKGGTKIATKATVKGGTKLAVESGTKAIINTGTKVTMKGVKQGMTKQLFKSAGRNIIIGTASGIALVPVVGGLRKITIKDEETDITDSNIEEFDNNYDLDDYDLDDYNLNDYDLDENFDN